MLNLADAQQGTREPCYDISNAECVAQGLQEALKLWYLLFVSSAAANALRCLPFCCLCDGILPRKWTAVNESTGIRGKFCSWCCCFVKKRLVWTEQKRNLFPVRFRGFHCSSDAGRGGGGAEEARCYWTRREEGVAEMRWWAVLPYGNLSTTPSLHPHSRHKLSFIPMSFHQYMYY